MPKLSYLKQRVKKLFEKDETKIDAEIKAFIAKNTGLQSLKMDAKFEGQLVQFIKEQLAYLEENKLLNKDNFSKYLTVLFDEIEKNFDTHPDKDLKNWDEEHENYYQIMILAASVEYHSKLYKGEISTQNEQESKLAKYKDYADTGRYGLLKFGFVLFKLTSLFVESAKQLNDFVKTGGAALGIIAFASEGFDVIFQIGAAIKDYITSAGKPQSERFRSVFTFSRTTNIVLSTAILGLGIAAFVTGIGMPIAASIAALMLVGEISRLGYYIYRRNNLSGRIEKLEETLAAKKPEADKVEAELKSLKEQLNQELQSGAPDRNVVLFLQNQIKEKTSVLGEFQTVKTERDRLAKEYNQLKQDQYYKVGKMIFGIVFSALVIVGIGLAIAFPVAAPFIAVGLLGVGLGSFVLFKGIDIALTKYRANQAKKAEATKTVVSVDDKADKKTEKVVSEKNVEQKQENVEVTHAHSSAIKARLALSGMKESSNPEEKKHQLEELKEGLEKSLQQDRRLDCFEDNLDKLALEINSEEINLGSKEKASEDLLKLMEKILESDNRMFISDRLLDKKDPAVNSRLEAIAKAINHAHENDLPEHKTITQTISEKYKPLEKGLLEKGAKFTEKNSSGEGESGKEKTEEMIEEIKENISLHD